MSLVLAGGFFWVLRRGGLPLLPSNEALSRIAWWCLPAYTAVLAATTVLRTYRWVYLLNPLAILSQRHIFGVGLVGAGFIFFAPLRMGEFARPLLISRGNRVDFVQATGTIAAERVIDGLMVSLILLFGLLTSVPLDPLPDHLGKLELPIARVPTAAYSALVLFSGAFFAMGLFYWARSLARRVTHATVGLVSEKLALFLSEKVERLADGLKFLPSARSSVPFFRDTLLYWLCGLLLVWVGMRGCGIEASFSQSCVVLGIVGLGILVPAGPGFFGAYQFSAYCGLALFFPESLVLTGGAAYIFISYTTQLAFSVLGMIVGYFLMDPPGPLLEVESSPPPG